MLLVAANPAPIAIRNAGTRRVPTWLAPALPFVPLYLLLAASSWLTSPPGMEWWPWALVALAGLGPLASWLGSIATIEVDPTRITVRRHLRSQRAPMGDVLRIDARKMPWGLLARYRPAPYVLDVWLTGYRHWRLGYIEPEAGDRLLAELHGYHKPIWVVRTA